MPLPALPLLLSCLDPGGETVRIRHGNWVVSPESEVTNCSLSLSLTFTARNVGSDRNAQSLVPEKCRTELPEWSHSHKHAKYAE